ncbi:glycosyltransferase family 2 protein [Aestuariibacter sp. GS-14]|uniref:glycosyltransferase family 2 protein n=1 Tax=Aestuariibacter sp. GS-14 TaxID=2590670 RepID=UPI001127860E|nr:glycosyltransferase family 2 protein [Aestuariibacter sp. GS-14]TPV59008.1 glycosyltransferase family 2 protein [Aestuariibacter sp. GS-14]
MKLNAILIVKNEADIVEESLLFAMKFCHKIYVYDNSSTDGTWQIVQSMADRFKEIVIYGQAGQASNGHIANRIYNQYSRHYGELDWWYIPGADELLCETPVPLLEEAAEQGKTCVSAWQARFYFTDRDYQYFDSEDVSKPVSQRRKFYAINWKEERFFINKPGELWSEDAGERMPPWANKPFKKAPVCRHYPERTPLQINARRALKAIGKSCFVQDMTSVKKNLREASKLDTYQNDNHFVFRQSLMLRYHVKKARQWIANRIRRVNQQLSLITKKHVLGM